MFFKPFYFSKAIIGVALLLSSSVLYSAENNTHIFYPVYNDKHDNVIKLVLSDIRANIKGYSLKEVPIEIDENKDNKFSLKLSDISPEDKVITLTSAITTLIIDSDYGGNILEGFPDESVASSNQVTRVEAITSPSDYIQAAKLINPKLKYIHAVLDTFDSKNQLNQWKNAAKAQGITLKTSIIESNRTAFSTIFSFFDTHSASLEHMLYVDQKVLDRRKKSVLNFVVEQSWSNRNQVITNNINHVKQGLLFSLSINYKTYGSRLLKLLNISKPEKHTQSGKLNSDVMIYLNYRAISHLGLKVNENHFPSSEIVVPYK